MVDKEVEKGVDDMNQFLHFSIQGSFYFVDSIRLIETSTVAPKLHFADFCGG